MSKGRVSKSFFTIPEYEAWKAEVGSSKGWKIKYYKGLGTSTPQEAKEYFSDIDRSRQSLSRQCLLPMLTLWRRHKIDFHYSGAEDDRLIDLAFSKKSADLRKTWIGAFTPGTFLDQNVERVSYTDFVNRELILFSIESNVRAIPSMVDGFKPGQRKIIYSCFKRNLVKEIKVAQLAGYVSEHSSYHHAEASLAGTIVGLAQNFVGNNNLNLLYPAGQFGTRSEGGGDAASPRYIFTHLCPITRLVFNATDDHILKYLDDDGQLIEPEWFDLTQTPRPFSPSFCEFGACRYMPVLPMVLVNGSSGIGTGYSTSVPNYNPREIVANIKRITSGEAPLPMHPWYKNFRGEIAIEGKKKGYTVRGLFSKVDDTHIRITYARPPVQTASGVGICARQGAAAQEVDDGVPQRRARGAAQYLFYDSLRNATDPCCCLEEGFISGFKEHHTDTTIDFDISMPEVGPAVPLCTRACAVRPVPTCRRA